VLCIRWLQHIFSPGAVCVHNWSQFCIPLKESLRKHLPNSRGPYKNTVARLVDHFRESGSVEGLVCLTNENVEDVRQRMFHSHTKSLRKLVLQASMSYSSAQRATENYICIHPYRIHVIQELKEPDKAERLPSYEWFHAFIEENWEWTFWAMFCLEMEHGFTLTAVLTEHLDVE
jgi:hypothetical protein